MSRCRTRTPGCAWRRPPRREMGSLPTRAWRPDWPALLVMWGLPTRRRWVTGSSHPRVGHRAVRRLCSSSSSRPQGCSRTTPARAQILHGETWAIAPIAGSFARSCPIEVSGFRQRGNGGALQTSGEGARRDCGRRGLRAQRGDNFDTGHCRFFISYRHVEIGSTSAMSHTFTPIRDDGLGPFSGRFGRPRGANGQPARVAVVGTLRSSNPH